MWLNQDWPVLPTPHVDKFQVDTESHSIGLASGDGSPIGCRKAPDLFEFKIVDKQLPSVEFDFDLTFPLLNMSNYLNQYFIGQTFSDFEFVPDGNSHGFTAFIDTAVRYHEAHVMKGIAGEQLWQPISDASIPTAGSFTPAILLYAEQDGSHFVTGFAGTRFVHSPGGTPYTGDWSRVAGATAAADVRTLSGAAWQKVGPIVMSGGQQTFLSAVPPDFSNGAPPIYFGWGSVTSTQSQIGITGLPGGDLRWTQWHQTMRLDRFCMTIK